MNQFNEVQIMADVLALEKKVKEQEELIAALRGEFAWVSSKLDSRNPNLTDISMVCYGLSGVAG